MAFYDFRAVDLRPIVYNLGFRDVVFDTTYNVYVPNQEYSGDVLVDNPFDATVTLHEVNLQYPFGNYKPFLTLKATSENNEIVVSYNDVKKVRIVASAEWVKPGDTQLSVWSTSAFMDLKAPGEHDINLIMNQVSLGRNPLMSTVSFAPVVNSALSITNQYADLSIELIRVDLGAKLLPGSWRASHKLRFDETLVMDLPRGQWFYSVRSVEA